MQTPEFDKAVRIVEALAQHRRPALMCAEAVPWRCHRSLIADAILVRGLPAKHIMTAARADLHTLRDFARVEGKQITYPPIESD